MAYKKQNIHRSNDDREDARDNRGSRRNNKGKKPFRGKSSKKDSDVTSEEKLSPSFNSCNDPAWYGVGTELMKSTYNLPQLEPLGELYRWRTYSNGNSKWQVQPQSAPGYLAYLWAPVFDYTEDGADPLNTAFANMFSFVRNANSGKTNYSQSALASYMLGANGIVSFMAHLRRTYGVLTKFDGTNIYTPARIVEAMGFDYDDLVKNKTQFLNLINYYSAKCSAIWLPVTSTLTQRWEFMNSFIYADSETIKPQQYFFRPAGLYYWCTALSKPGESGLYYMKFCDGQQTSDIPAWNHDTMANNDYLKTHFLDVKMNMYIDQNGEMAWPVPDGQTHYNYYGTPDKMKYAAIEQLVKFLIDAFIADEDRGTIAGDLLKAYGAGAMYKWPLIDEFYTVPTAFNAEVATQFRNARTPYWLNFNGQEINDDGVNLLVSTTDCNLPDDATFGAIGDCCDISAYLTFDHIANDADIAIATRLIPFTDGGGHVLSSGTEVVIAFEIGDTYAENGMGVKTYERIRFGTFLKRSGDNTLRILRLLRAFSMAPMVITTNVEGSGANRRTVMKEFFIDADNYFQYTYDQAVAINRGAKLFEYGVPLSTGVSVVIKQNR